MASAVITGSVIGRQSPIDMKPAQKCGWLWRALRRQKRTFADRNVMEHRRPTRANFGAALLRISIFVRAARWLDSHLILARRAFKRCGPVRQYRPIGLPPRKSHSG